MTGAILEALVRLAPDGRDVFAKNRARWLARLDDSLARWTRALAPYRGTRAVVVHDSWPYFARRFGLVVVAAVEPAPGVPPSAASLAALTAKMRQARVRLVIGEPSSNASLVSHVAARGGARAVVLVRSEEHTSELQSPCNLVCRLLLEKKKRKTHVKHQQTQESSSYSC